MSMRKSASLICTSTSSASGRTATVTVEVWMRPCVSVVGTRWTRWTPDSYLKRAKTFLPVISAMPSFRPPSSFSAEFGDFEAPAFCGGVFLVGLEEFGGEEAGFVAAGGGADFEDGAAFVGFVARQEGDADFVLQGGQARAEFAEFLFGEVAHFGIGEQGFGAGCGGFGGAQFLDAGDDGFEFGEFFRGAGEGFAGEAGAEVGAQFFGAGDDAVEFIVHHGVQEIRREVVEGDFALRAVGKVLDGGDAGGRVRHCPG